MNDCQNEDAAGRFFIDVGTVFMTPHSTRYRFGLPAHASIIG